MSSTSGSVATDNLNEILEAVHTVESVCGRREIEGQVEYFVKWKNLSENENTWVSADKLEYSPLVQQFETKMMAFTTRSRNKCNSKKERIIGRFRSTLSTPRTQKSLDLFENGQEAESILGAIRLEGIIYFLVQFKNIENAKFVTSHVANVRIPQMVIKFYEQRMVWDLPCDDYVEDGD